MAISLNPQNLAAAQNFLKQVGMAVDPSSSRGVQVSIDEARKIADAYEAIPDAGTKQVVGKALLQLIQADLFEVPSQGAKDVIAKVIGKPADQVFSARDRAELVGGASIKTVAAATMGLLAKMPSLDKAQVEKLMGGLDKIPAEAKNLVMAVLNKSGKDNEVKFNADARAPFTKGYAKSEVASGGAVSKIEQAFTEKNNGPMEAFAAQMMASPYFEDRLAALMMTICHKTMKDVDESLRSLDDTVKRDNETAGKKKTGGALGGPATGATGQITKGPGAAQDASSKLRGSYESLVQSAAAHRSDDGVITGAEAQSLAKKLDQIQPPEAKMLQAEAMGRGLLAVGGGDLTPELQPLADWVQQTTGKKLTEIGDAKGLYEATTPLAQTIGGSDKLENKVAAYIIEGVFGDGKSPKMAAVLGEMKPLMAAMEKQITGASAEEVRSAAPKTSQHSTSLEDRFGRLAGALKQGKIPTSELTNVAKSMVDRLPVSADKKAILAGVTEGLSAIAGDKDLDVKSAFSKSVAPLVEEAGQSGPDFQKLVGGSVDEARNAASEDLFNAKDSGKTLSLDEKRAILDEKLGGAKAKLLAEGEKNGYDAGQMQALGASFDVEAQAVHKELGEKGTVSATEPRGLGAESVDPTGTSETRSRQIMFETLKLKMTRLSEMMQAMSNILNAMHQTAENSIRAIR